MNNSEEIYHPHDDIVQQAHIKEYEQLYRFSIENREQFWAQQAESLAWYKKWDTVLDQSNKPFYKWFKGGETNIILNAIDRHLGTPTQNKLAYAWEGEDGEVKPFSYHALNREVTQFANILKAMGVKKGHIVTIYMPQIPEQIFAMLACAKIGAAHSVVYGGFSAEALHERVKAAKSRVIVTADGGFRRGKATQLKKIVNEALEMCSVVEVVITVKRTGEQVEMQNDRDFWYHDLKALPIVHNKCETERMQSDEMLFLLYTSGSTGKPKGLVHTHGGYSVYAATIFK